MENLTNGRDAREEFTQRLSDNTAGDALDAISRADFESDADYLDAAAKKYLEQSSPEYQRAYKKLAAEYQHRKEAEQTARQSARQKELAANVQLDSVERGNIDKQALELARRDIAAGRISYSSMGESVERYAKELTEKAKSEKVGRQLFNEIIRGKI